MNPIHEEKRMRKQWAAMALMLATGTLALAGNDPWTSKPYQQWDDKDIAKILQMSPWSHTVPVEMTWKALSIEDIEAAQSPSGVSDAHSSPAGSGNKAGGTYMPGEHDEAAYTRGPEANFMVYWSSSKTIREAEARSNELKNGGDPKAAEDFVSKPLDEYEILVQGKDMAPFDRVEEKGYASMAWLQLKGSKQKIMPTHVMYTHDAKIQAAVNGAVFYFPKKNADGSPTIPPDMKSVDFYCKVGASTMHVVFEPQKMKNAEGLDL
jgi:hypothetical protein